MLLLKVNIIFCGVFFFTAGRYLVIKTIVVFVHLLLTHFFLVIDSQELSFICIKISIRFCVFLLIKKYDKIFVYSLHIVIRLYYWFIYLIRWCQVIWLATRNKNWSYFYGMNSTPVVFDIHYFIENLIYLHGNYDNRFSY